MVNTVGRVDFIVDMDGSVMPAQAAAIGALAGTIAAKSFDRAFNAELNGFSGALRRKFAAIGAASGTALGQGLERKVLPSLSSLNKALDNTFSGRQIEGFQQVMGGLSDDLEDIIIEFEDIEEHTTDFGDSLRRSTAQIGSFQQATQSSSSELDIFRSRVGASIPVVDELGDGFQELRIDIDRAAGSSGGGGGGGGGGLDGFVKNLKKSNDESKKLGKTWSSLPHNFRQVLLIIGAIAGGGEQIATLGSAAGVGLTVLAGSATTAFTAIGVLIAGLQGVDDQLELFKERDKLLEILPADRTEEQVARLAQLKDAIAALDPAYESIRRLGGGFSALQDSIQNALLNGAAPAIDNLTNNLLPALEVGLSGIAARLQESLGGLIGRLTSEDGIGKLDQIFREMQLQIEPLISSIANIGGAFANVLIAGGPFVTKFLGWLDQITGRFNDFTGTVEGQSALREWFANGTKVLSAFADLLGGIGGLLANLVDDESVQRTVDFLDNLTGSLPFLEKIIDVLGELDAFGLIAQILNDLGNALVPVLDLLDPVARILNVIIENAIAFQTTVVQLIGLALTPLKFGLDLIADAITVLVEWFQPLLEGWSEVLTAVQLVADEFFESLKPAFDELWQAIINLLPDQEEMARIIQQEVIPAIKEFGNWLRDHAIPWLSKAIDAVTDFINAFGGFEGISQKTGALISIITTFANGVMFVLNPVIRIIRSVLDGLVALGAIKKIQAPAIAIGGGRTTAFASGGIADQPTYGVFGEAGREAMVPLDRPLSQVDPSVRTLSAIAQGLANPASFGGGGGSSKSLTVAAGAIQVNGVRNPGQAASAALDRLVALTSV